MQLMLFAGLVIAVAAAVFALQNTTQVPVTFLFWQTWGSLALVLITAFVLGAVTAILFAVPANVRRLRELSFLRKRMGELEDRVAGREHTLKV